MLCLFCSLVVLVLVFFLCVGGVCLFVFLKDCLVLLIKVGRKAALWALAGLLATPKNCSDRQLLCFPPGTKHLPQHIYISIYISLSFRSCLISAV